MKTNGGLFLAFLFLVSVPPVSNGAGTPKQKRPIARVLLTTGETVQGELLNFSGGMLILRPEKIARRVFWPNVISFELVGVVPAGNSRGAAKLAYGKELLKYKYNNLAPYVFREALALEPLIAKEIKAVYSSAGIPLPKMLGGTSDAGRLVAYNRHYNLPTLEQVQFAMKQAKEWGEAGKKLTPAMHLIETQHFLIYSAWSKTDDNALKQIYEKLYRALCTNMRINPLENIWIGKLPVYVFWHEKDFENFTLNVVKADRDTAMNSGGFAGYREYRHGGRFRYVVLNAVKVATTSNAEAKIWFYEILAHESTHAFMGRYINERILPNWLSEGIAETMASTLVPQANSIRKLAFLMQSAQQLDLQTNTIFDVRNIPGNDISYGMCQSLVRYLNKKGATKFGLMIEAIKAGKTDDQALQEAYGITREQLVYEWKRNELKIPVSKLGPPPKNPVVKKPVPPASKPVPPATVTTVPPTGPAPKPVPPATVTTVPPARPAPKPVPPATVTTVPGNKLSPVVLKLSDSVELKLVPIPAGSFIMGSAADEADRSSREGPQQKVTFTKPFFMGATEVTQAQYEAVMGNNPSKNKGAKNPVENVTWQDARTYCQRLSKLINRHVRLPTEAEWEYACRAGTTTRFSYGNSKDDLFKYGNYADRTCTEPWQGIKDDKQSDSHDRSSPVASFKPNPWGLYDMHGNVLEWCLDSPSGYTGKAATDPDVKIISSYRVNRGGCWRDIPSKCRSARRNFAPVSYTSPGFGFRVVIGRPLKGETTQDATAPLVTVQTVPPATVTTVPGKKLSPVVLKLSDSVELKLVPIPAGSFIMGSAADEADRSSREGPQQKVTFTKPFFMGATEVTQAQYEAVMGINPSEFRGANRPVENVTWHDARTYCQRLSKLINRHVRLPTEAEWEYACRAGTTTRFSFGNRDEDFYKYGNYADRTCTKPWRGKDENHNDGHDRTSPAGSFKPNPWGLYDMHGNVWEWVLDGPLKYNGKAVIDPDVKIVSSHRVNRGGTWCDLPHVCRSAKRNFAPASYKCPAFGFRVVIGRPLKGAAQQQ